MRRSFAAIAFGLLCLYPAAAVNAGIVTRSDSIQEISPPPDLRQGVPDLESNTTVSLFVERLDFTLPEELPLDVSDAGTWLDSPGHFSPGTADVGKLIDVYFLRFDPVGTPSQPRRIEGSITFDADILGVITKTNSLLATHPILGLGGVIYPTGDNQGTEPNNAGTFLTLSEDRRTVSFRLAVDTHIDTFRIVTTVPEASSVILLALGGGILSLFHGIAKLRQQF